MTHSFQAIAIGASAGGTKALSHLLPCFKRPFPWTLFVVQHVAADVAPDWVSIFRPHCELPILLANHGEWACPGSVIFAPPDYHLLIEMDRSLALSVGPLQNYARPSIDVFFTAAARVFRTGLIAVLLTGSSCDGVRGLQAVKDQGGYVVAQDPSDADYPAMPQGAISAGCVDRVIALAALPDMLARLLEARP